MVGEPFDFLANPVTPGLPAPAGTLGGFQKAMGKALKIIGLRIFHEAGDLLTEGAVIAFECQEIVGLGAGNFRGDFGLATHRVNGDNAVSTSSGSTSLSASGPEPVERQGPEPAEGHPASLSVRSSSGMAVISLLFSSAFVWPRSRPFSRAHALTM